MFQEGRDRLYLAEERGIAVLIYVPLMLGLLLLLAVGLYLLQRVQGPQRLPYRPVDSLLTPAEMRFYVTLRQVVGARFLIMVKVRLADLVHITATGKDWWRGFAPIASKHADFVLADPQTLAPLLVVELDDSTHQRADRRDRDSKVDAVLASVNLPILHIPVRKSYDPGVLAEQIRTCVRARA